MEQPPSSDQDPPSASNMTEPTREAPPKEKEIPPRSCSSSSSVGRAKDVSSTGSFSGQSFERTNDDPTSSNLTGQSYPKEDQQPSTSSASSHGDLALSSTNQQIQTFGAPQMHSTGDSAVPMSTTEQALWKIIRAANVLKSSAEQWSQYMHSSAALRRHMNRCSNAVTALQKASVYATHIGTTAKVVGGVMSLAGLISQNPMLRGMGSKVWKSGCVVKFAGLAGSLLLQIWNNGFQTTLSAYLLCLSGIVQNMMLIRSVLEELQVLDPVDLEPGKLMPLLLLVCPEDLFTYACHIVRTLISHEHYSAFNDFLTMALSTIPATSILPVRILYEIESCQVFDCLSELPTPMQHASAAAHVGKEIIDFFSSLNSLQGQDYFMLRNLLHRLRTASSSFLESMRNLPLLNVYVSGGGDSVNTQQNNVPGLFSVTDNSDTNERSSESSDDGDAQQRHGAIRSASHGDV